MSDIQERYAYYRRHNPDAPASYALGCVRYEQAQAALDIDWDFDAAGLCASFVVGTLERDGRTIKVYVGDDDPVDWGDIEPSDAEREASSSFWIGAGVGDDDLTDSIGGVDVIDLPGYVQRDWNDAARYALLEYLLPQLDHELAERAEWEARDVVTV